MASASSGSGGGFADASRDEPWPYPGRGTDRTYNGGQADAAVDPTAWTQDKFGDLSGNPRYVSATVADLDEDPRREIVTNLASLFGDGLVAAYDPDGTQLWNDTGEGAAGLQMIPDVDEDPSPEVFVTFGNEHRRYEANGSLTWTASAPEPYKVEGFANHPLALDVNSDGVQDVISTAAIPEQDEISEARHGEVDQAILYGLDGRNGDRLFADEICGHRLTALVGFDTDDGPLVVTGCEEGARNASAGAVEGLRIENVDDGILDTVLAPFGDLLQDDDYRVEQAWRTEIQNTEPVVMRTLAADVHRHEGTEVVAHWFNDTGSGVTALDPATGDVVAEGFDDRGDRGVPFVTSGAGDLDGDGLDELVFEPDADRIAAYNLFDSGLEPIWTLPDDEQDGLAAANYSPTAASLADHDGDGRPEVWTDWQREPGQARDGDHIGGQHRVYDSTGRLLFNKTLRNDPSENQRPPVPIRHHAIADLDRDGTLEQVHPISSSIAVYEGKARVGSS